MIDAILVDEKSIYTVPVPEGAQREAVLTAYMRASGERWRDSMGCQYTYWVNEHASGVYSVRRAIKRDSTVLYNMTSSMLAGTADIADWWARAYPIIAQIADVTGAVTGVAALAAAPFAFVKWVRGKLKSKSANEEHKWIKNILREDTWNAAVLAAKISFPEEQAKHLLKGLGYVWDAHSMLYTATDNTIKLRDQNPVIRF